VPPSYSGRTLALTIAVVGFTLLILLSAAGAGIVGLVYAIHSQNFALAAIILAAFLFWALYWRPASRRTVHLKTEVVIARDPEAVFAFASDLRNMRFYMPGVDAVEKVGDEPIQVGTRFRLMIQGNDTFTDTAVLTEYEPPRHFAWSSEGDDDEPDVETVTLAPADGATRLTLESDDQESYGAALVGTALLLPFSRWVTTRAQNKFWERMKLLLESDAN
jgi:uncharacterized protein YndB with AHSA1/START domain